ncbi:MAG: hypothetical protein JRH20_22235 [Deltaproteobacteria bacterium]|nr:hypothetical protein [Deltaproteobacteria bacterium]
MKPLSKHISLARVLTLTLSLSLSVLPGCDASKPGGCASTCAGCCTGEECHPGTFPNICGVGGAVCSVCPAGQPCVAGQCGGTSACTPSCTGCCEVGICQGGLAHNACGSGAAPCQNCVIEGKICDAATQSCKAPPPLCPNCATGCCQGNTCLSGNTDTACGALAQACTDCSRSGLTCDVNARQCLGGGVCGECPTGCCKDGKCEVGFADGACGGAGRPCDDCTLVGHKCDPATRYCSQNPCLGCAGCCTGTACVTGDSVDACGSGGQSCVNCTAMGRTCKKVGAVNQCELACEACIGGCCLGQICVGGTSDTACGNNNLTCEDCASRDARCDEYRRTCIGGCPNCFTGCCLGLECKSGTSNFACGNDGEFCKNCATRKYVCSPATQTCVPPP